MIAFNKMQFDSPVGLFKTTSAQNVTEQIILLEFRNRVLQELNMEIHNIKLNMQ